MLCLVIHQHWPWCYQPCKSCFFKSTPFVFLWVTEVCQIYFCWELSGTRGFLGQSWDTEHKHLFSQCEVLPYRYILIIYQHTWVQYTWVSYSKTPHVMKLMLIHRYSSCFEFNEHGLIKTKFSKTRSSTGFLLEDSSNIFCVCRHVLMSSFIVNTCNWITLLDFLWVAFI